MSKEINETLRSAELLLAQVEALRLAEENAKRSSRSRTAENFEPVSLFHPLETDLSRLIGFFLNPLETHEQGELFLTAFCRTLRSCRTSAKSGAFPEGELPPMMTDRTKITLEHTIPEGRLDILLRDGNTLLAIENKPWASEGKDQLAKYAAWLERTAPGKWWLVFLSENKPTSPPRDETRRRRVVHLSFAELADALKEAAAHIEAVRVRSFVELFSDYLKHQIAGITPMTNTPLMELLKDPKNLSSAMRIVEAYQNLRPAAWENFTEYLRKECGLRYGDEVAFYATPRRDFGKDWLYIWFTPKGANNWCLCFADEVNNDMRRFFWGISTENNEVFLFEKKPELSQALRTMCISQFGSDNSKGNNRYWAWWRWGFDGKGYMESNDFPQKLESAEFMPMMFSSGETSLSRMIFSKVDAVLEALREDQDLRKIALLAAE